MTRTLADTGRPDAPTAGAPARRQNVIELRHVARRFGPVTALADLSLAVPPGSITVLVGPNGAGKTTALRVITGAIAPDDGEVRVFGLDPNSPDGEQVRRRCGVVAAKPALYDRLSGRDNLRYAAELFGLGAAEAPIEGAAARFGIEQALDLKVAGYSTGMKTRLALARAVVHDPDLLLLDEPTSGLDPESSRAVLELIHEMTGDGKTVVMSTHLLLEAEGLADQVVIMEDGSEVVAGSTDELMRRYWPFPTVVFDAQGADDLERLVDREGVAAVEHDGSRARVTVDDLARVPELVAFLVGTGVRLTAVTPHRPSLEELYLRVRSRP
ncbi:MAG TPA: ABC transporter ATP-binding protein [Acidimicrobiales bacterium]|nr:ABC transporter ATP-binding protein [Acidimicrobiales bacterium]